MTRAFGKSIEVLPSIRDQSIDLIYIDGSHAYADVLHDVQQSKRLIRPGGIICGDDLEMQAEELGPGVLEADLKGGRDYIEHWRMHAYHPGVTAAVKNELGHVGAEDGFWSITMP